MPVCRRSARAVLGAAVVAATLHGPSSQAAGVVEIERFADPASATDTVHDTADLAPILKQCLFGTSPSPGRISPRTFALRCVVPYIHGLWLDPKILYRSHADIVAQARDRLIEHPAGKPFPIFYPPSLAQQVESALHGAIAPGDNVVLEPLPDPLPRPSLDPASLYNNIGLLYLPNACVVPGDTFNEMYGWDSFFIIEGLLASVDAIMNNPTTLVWSPEDKTLYPLSTDPSAKHYYRHFAKRLFDTAKGMVDNHIFEIEYYGFVLNANRTYYLTRSQPPLFTQEALAVLRSARAYGFAYEETLAPYLAAIDPTFVAPRNFQEWIAREVLPAAQRYYAYWTDPRQIRAGSDHNPRVASVEHRGQRHPVYLYGTTGIGPAPEVARSTQPQNRQLYQSHARYFEAHPEANLGHLFYHPENVCAGPEPTGGCGDPVYGLTQTFYAADRAIRASGYDLSGRFGEAGEWAMHYAPISLNVLLLRMAEDIDRLAMTAGQAPPHGADALEARRRFLADFFARGDGGYGDRYVGGALPAGRERFAYPYATQAYLLWAEALDDPGAAFALLQALQQAGDGEALLAGPETTRFGVPSSTRDTGMQWDAPFAWAPVQYFAALGLLRNAFPAEAAVAMAQWIAAVNAFFARSAVLIEKYDSKDPTADARAKVGYAQTQRGFGWTNAVYLLFVNRLYQR